MIVKASQEVLTWIASAAVFALWEVSFEKLNVFLNRIL